MFILITYLALEVRTLVDPAAEVARQKCGSIQEVSKAVLVPVLPQQLLQASNSSAVEKPSPLFRENMVKSDRSGCNHATSTAAAAVSVPSIWTLRSGRDSADISPQA